MGCKEGGIVGYEVRFDKKCGEKTLIKFVTEGILINELIKDSSLKKYNCVIIDEAHERGINSDVILGLMVRLLE